MGIRIYALLTLTYTAYGMSNKQDGFTVVEILVAIAVAAVILTTLNSALTTFIHLGQRGRYLSLANTFVERDVEGLRNDGYNALNIGTTSLTSSLPSGLPPGSSGTQVVNQPMLGVKQIDITISYKDQAQTLNYGYTTYIGELGVGQQ